MHISHLYKNFKNLSALILVFVYLSLDHICNGLAPDSCHLRELELCVVGAASIFQNPNGIPIGEKELKRQCEYLMESKTCFKDYKNQCMGKHQESVISLFDNDLSSLADEFCDEKSELRKTYKELAPCLRRVQQKYQKVYITDLQVGFESIHKLNHKTRLATACCNVNRFKEGLMSKIEEECGSESGEFVNGLLVRVVSNAFKNLCRSYNADYDGCKDLLPPPGSTPHVGRNTSAISRVVSSYAIARA